MASSRIFVPADSTEYISIKVIGTSNGTTIDLGSTPVEIGIRAIHSVNAYGPVIFYTAEWEVVSGVYFARVLIGPESLIVLAEETYNMWVKVFATPQLLVRKSPTILEIRPPETE